MELNYVVIGRKIRGLRKQRKLTQEKLAEAADISMSFLGHIERGSRKLSVETLFALCHALNTSADFLLGIPAVVPEESLKSKEDVLALIEMNLDRI